MSWNRQQAYVLQVSYRWRHEDNNKQHTAEEPCLRVGICKRCYAHRWVTKLLLKMKEQPLNNVWLLSTYCSQFTAEIIYTKCNDRKSTWHGGRVDEGRVSGGESRTVSQDWDVKEDSVMMERRWKQQSGERKTWSVREDKGTRRKKTGSEQNVEIREQNEAGSL